MSGEDTFIYAMFVVGIGCLTAVPVALPMAALWSTVLPGTFEHMPSVLAGFGTWFVLYMTAAFFIGKKLGL